MGFVFAPEQPLPAWLSQLDSWLARSPGFFLNRLAVLDLTGMSLGREQIAGLLTNLQERSIRIAAIEGMDPAQLGPELPPHIETLGQGAAKEAQLERRAEAIAIPAPKGPTSLVIDTPVRSGQSIVFTEGDLTILGSVGSGAEVVAGGSIHIYGTLRGRAMAGATGNARARIFCHRIDAELLAIDGYYMTADQVETELRGKPTQTWLDGSTMMVTALN
jgi:septum site-determining protein MinC